MPQRLNSQGSKVSEVDVDGLLDRMNSPPCQSIDCCGKFERILITFFEDPIDLLDHHKNVVTYVAAKQ